ALEDGENIGLRNAAVEALVAIGPDAVGATIEASRRLDSDARKLAVEVLGGIADARGTAALVRMLADGDLNVRVTVAEALGNAALAGETSRAMAIAALVSELADRDTLFKLAVFGSLARLEARLPWSVFEAHVDDPVLRRQVISATARSRDPAAVRVLARATGDPSPIAREAIVILGDLIAESASEGATLDCARAELTKNTERNARRAAADTDDPRGRAGALLVLGLVGAAEDVPLLIDALGDDDVAERAEIALRIAGAKAGRPLLAAASAGTSRVRVAALTLVASLDVVSVTQVRSALRRALGDSSLEVVQCAVEALGSRGDARDLRRMGQRVGDGDERVAAAAAKSVFELAARHVEAARSLLRSRGLWRDSPTLGCILLGAIASVQPMREADARLLQSALANPEPRVRRAAIEALAQGGGDA
ncbi:MAG: HEAT repeat domain-containing protein, partial [Polyangiaceae bacterium]